MKQKFHFRLRLITIVSLLCYTTLAGVQTAQAQLIQVTYDANAGSGGPTIIDEFNSTQIYTIRDNTINDPSTPGTHFMPPAPGLGFIGWNTQADGSGDWYSEELDVYFNNSITLFAQWGTVWEIWNWDDLSRVMEKQAWDYTQSQSAQIGVVQFKIMQNIGIPGQTGSFGEGAGSGRVGNDKYGWYGYQGYTGNPGDIGNTTGFDIDDLDLDPRSGWEGALGWKPLGANVTPVSGITD
jgi:hypothetical protein